MKMQIIQSSFSLQALKQKGRKHVSKSFTGISVACGMQVLNLTKCPKLIRMPAVMLGSYALMPPWPLYCTSHFNNFSDNEGYAMLIFKCRVMWYLDIRERKPFLLTHRKWTCVDRKLFFSKKSRTKQPHKHCPFPGFSPMNNKKWQVLCFIQGMGRE